MERILESIQTYSTLPSDSSRVSYAQGILARVNRRVLLWRSGAVSTTYPAGLPKPSVAEGLTAG